MRRPLLHFRIRGESNEQAFRRQNLSTAAFSRLGSSPWSMAAMGTMLPLPAHGRRIGQTGTLEEVRIGFIPLTDCSSVVMASVARLRQEYGIKITPAEEASWAGVRQAGQWRGCTRPMCCTAWCMACIWASAAQEGHGRADDPQQLNGQAITLCRTRSRTGCGGRCILSKLVAKRRNTPSPRPSLPAPTPCGSTGCAHVIDPSRT